VDRKFRIRPYSPENFVPRNFHSLKWCNETTPSFHLLLTVKQQKYFVFATICLIYLTEILYRCTNFSLKPVRNYDTEVTSNHWVSCMYYINNNPQNYTANIGAYIAYDLNCVESAVEPQPTNLVHILWKQIVLNKYSYNYVRQQTFHRPFLWAKVTGSEKSWYLVSEHVKFLLSTKWTILLIQGFFKTSLSRFPTYHSHYS